MCERERESENEIETRRKRKKGIITMPYREIERWRTRKNMLVRHVYNKPRGRII